MLGIATAVAYAAGPTVWWCVSVGNGPLNNTKATTHYIPSVFSLLFMSLDVGMARGSLLIFSVFSQAIYVFFAVKVNTKDRDNDVRLWINGAIIWLAVLALSGSVSYGQYYLGLQWNTQILTFLMSIASSGLCLLLLWWALVKPNVFLPILSRQVPSEFEQKTYEQAVSLCNERQIFKEEGLSLDKMANRLAVTPRELSSAINKCTGKGFRAFLRYYRVQYAQSLLRDVSKKDIAVLDIGLSAGFGTKSSFNEAFKAETGFTPTEYRDSHLL